MRWSAAKGVARLAERLPKDFASQVLETILGLFEIHSLAAASLYDLPAIAESTWHGACLSCAEIARRNLIEPEHLHQLIEWLSKVRSRTGNTGMNLFFFLSVSHLLGFVLRFAEGCSFHWIQCSRCCILCVMGASTLTKSFSIDTACK